MLLLVRKQKNKMNKKNHLRKRKEHAQMFNTIIEPMLEAEALFRNEDF